jgi:outer membrane immunogenic protein
VHGGGGTMTNSSGANVEGLGNAGNGTLNGKGAVAGGQAGCNYQDGNWVFGLEGEGFWSGIKVANTASFLPNVLNGNTLETLGTTVKNNNDFTIAGRAGIALDRTLIYAKGGWAWGSMKANFFDTCCGANPTTISSSWGGTLDGFLVGAGIEHALTRNWTVKLEYDYIGFGAKQLTLNQCNTVGVCANTQTFSMSTTKQLFKVGVNYLFDVGGAPLVAKY